MNFTDLLTKMKTIDEGGEIIKPVDAVEECGGMMPTPAMSASKQQDNLTMNVSMNGSGAGGVRDLLNVLKDIQDGPEVEPHHDQDAEHDVLVGDSYDNAPNEVTLDMDAVIPTGNDIHSKGREAEKVNGGGNPFNVDESLVRRLSNHYQSIKEERLNEFDVKLMNPGTITIDVPSKEVAAIIKTMKPTDYIEANAFKQKYPQPTDYQERNSWQNVYTGHKKNDEYNFVSKWNRDNNNLTIGQWLEKAKNTIKGAVTGTPADPVGYKAYRYDQQNPANNNRLGGSKAQDEKSFPIK
jgi:hypothetical protein